MEVNYIRIETALYGEPVEADLLDALLELGLIEYKRQGAESILIAESNCEDFRAMLRLATELEINPAGVETIMHMRKRMNELNEEIRRLRQLERAYRHIRP